MNKKEQSLLEEAQSRAWNYIQSYISGRITIEQLRFRLIQLVRQTALDDFTYRDGMLLVNQMINEYVNKPAEYHPNIWDSTRPELSIINIFNPGDNGKGFINPPESGEKEEKEEKPLPKYNRVGNHGDDD